MRGGISYWLSEHPAIVGFRWGADQLWLATWPSLIVSLSLFAVLAVSLHFLLNLLGRSRPVPLGPIPALHSLAVAAVSAIIFVGTLLSTAAEIRDTRGRGGAFTWRRRFTGSSAFRTRWDLNIGAILKLPLNFVGTRPSGRVFFWSYAFYLSRYLHLPRALFAVLRRRRRPVARVAAQCALVAMPFLWLEFSQSFQVLAILAASLAHVLVFGYRFWICAAAARGDGAAPPPATVVMGCQVGLLWCNVACHVGVLVLHFGGRRSGGAAASARGRSTPSSTRGSCGSSSTATPTTGRRGGGGRPWDATTIAGARAIGVASEVVELRPRGRTKGRRTAEIKKKIKRKKEENPACCCKVPAARDSKCNGDKTECYFVCAF
uniref:Elongation of fatty acids protein 3-like n=1 Tax=Ananas comosus var. bracteatus TaxID=296719 RepID=A0A6V7NLR4_ANACO|nr:unnamed protein product [Ananas comosus var. bracteatus]